MNKLLQEENISITTERDYMNGKMVKIRIMHIAQSAGGVDRYLQMLFKYLDCDVIENILVCSFDYNVGDYKGLVSSIEQLDIHRAISLSKDLKAISVVRRLIKKYKPDLVYAHSSKAGALSRIANIGLRNKCLYNPHGWAFNMRCSRVKQAMYKMIEKMLAPFCNCIICISDAEKKSALKKHICSKNKLRVIYNGIDLEQYESEKTVHITRKSIGIPNDAFILGMVGRLSPQKSPDIFIKAAKKIKEEISNAYFIIVGDGELKNDVERYARENNFADSLFITGWVKNPISYVELFDVAILLSRWEGFGLVLPEYMMAKKPIVATNVDAIPNIISDYKNGILVNPDDPDAACKAVLELHDNTRLREEMVIHGTEAVYSRFDAKRVAKEHEVLFRELIGVI